MKTVLSCLILFLILLVTGCRGSSQVGAVSDPPSPVTLAKPVLQPQASDETEDKLKKEEEDFNSQCPSHVGISIDAERCQTAGLTYLRHLNEAITTVKNIADALSANKSDPALRFFELSEIILVLEPKQKLLREKLEFYDNIARLKFVAFNPALRPEISDWLKDNFCLRLKPRINRLVPDTRLKLYDAEAKKDPFVAEEAFNLLRASITALPSLGQYCGQAVGDEVKQLQTTLATLESSAQKAREKGWVGKLCKNVEVSNFVDAADPCRTQSLNLSFVSWLSHKAKLFEPQLTKPFTEIRRPLELLQNRSIEFILNDDQGFFGTEPEQSEIISERLHPLLGIEAETLESGFLIPTNAGSGPVKLTAPPQDFLVPVSVIEDEVSRLSPKTEQGRDGKAIAVRALQRLDEELNNFNFYNAEVLYRTAGIFLSVAKDTLPESPGLWEGYRFLTDRNEISGVELSKRTSLDSFFTLIDQHLDIKIGDEVMKTLKARLK